MENEITKNISEQSPGGIYCRQSEGTIAGNTISGNTGGGIYGYHSNLVIAGNVISDNTVGGGLDIQYNTTALIKDNIIRGNQGDNDHAGGINAGPLTEVVHNIIYANITSSQGGGIRADQSDLIKDNLIVDNVCAGEGGGISFQGSPFGGDTIENNVIRGNSAESGGGISCESKAILKENSITENKSTQNGGGVYILPNAEIDLLRNEIKKNHASNDKGGGVYVDNAKAKIVENDICENVGNLGGGICSRFSKGLNIENNTISHNTGLYGGGIYLGSEYSAKVIANVLDENIGSLGGGIYMNKCFFLTITNNMISRNEAYGGGGMHMDRSHLQLANNTLFENLATGMGGGVLCCDSGVKISNHVLWSNLAPAGKQVYLWGDLSSSVLDIDHSDVKGGLDGVFVDLDSSLNWNDGMKASDPQFVDPVSSDLHILSTSPCRDTGSNEAVVSDCDLEGDLRISGNAVDMGADEFHLHLYCTGEFTPEGFVQAKILGEPDSSPVYLVFSGALLAEPLNLSIGTFYLDAPWILIDLMSTIPPSGLLQLPGDLPRLPPAPYDLHMQAFVAGNLTNLFTMEVR